MAKKRAQSQGRRTSSKRSEQAELEEFTSGVVTFVNESLKRADVQHDAIANFLFSSVCEGDVELALSRTSAGTPRLKALQDATGGALHLDKPSLSRHLRIGAINGAVRDKRWHSLGWSSKVALLPLIKTAADCVPALNRAHAAHEGDALTARRLNAWVQSERKLGPKPPARRTLTMASAKRLIALGQPLKDADILLNFAKRMNKSDASEREAFVDELQTLVGSLNRVLTVVQSNDSRPSAPEEDDDAVA